MRTLECTGCGHIEFDEAPAVCLVCGAGRSSFEDKPDAVKKPENPNELSEGDRKHIPVIVVVKTCGLIPDGSCTDVHVKVGEIEHVMSDEHHIRYIDYYLDHKFISRVWLSPGSCHPAAGLHVRATSGTITAVENCNVHGNWLTEVDI